MVKERLFNYVREEKVTLWAGAGLSKYAGFPLAWELKEIIYNKLTAEEKLLVDKTYPLDVLAEEFVRIKNDESAELINLLREIYSAEPLNCHLHNQLSAIPHIRNFITTNYDQLFEIAYNERLNVISRDLEVVSYGEKPFNLLKIHGDLRFPESLVITRSDYSKFYNLDKASPLWSLLISKIATEVILFIGYGYEDPNIWAICDHVSSYLLSARKPAFLVAPGYPLHRIEFLRQKGITYLDLSAEDFLNELKEDINNNILPDFREGFVSPDTLRAFLKNHNVNPTLKGNEDEYLLDALTGIERPLEGNLKVKFNEYSAESVKAFFETGLSSPLEIDESAASDMNILVEGLSMFREGEIATISVKKNPTSSIQFDLCFNSTGFELTNLSAQVYHGTKQFTIVVQIHNYRITINGQLSFIEKMDINFTMHNNQIHDNTKNAMDAYQFARDFFLSEPFIIFLRNGGSFINALPNKLEDKVKATEGYIRYIEHLKKIETHFGIRFRDFGIQCEEEEWTIRNLVRIIERKSLDLDNNEVTMTMSKIYKSTIDMVEKFEYENHDLDMNFLNMKEVELYGYRFSLAKCSIKVVCAKAVNLEEVRNRSTKEIKVISKTGKLLEFYDLDKCTVEKI